MIWLWVSVIVMGAIAICALLYVYEKRKQIFRKRTKEEKQAKKQAKLAKKSKVVAPAAEESKPKDELNLTEKVVEVIPEDSIQEEEYQPSNEFVVQDIFPTMPSRRMPIRRDANAYNQFKREFDYKPEKQSIKEQIKNLTPEMKALLLTGVLDRKEDDQF